MGVITTPIQHDYEFKSMVGKGAFGTVSVAEHKTLKVVSFVLLIGCSLSAASGGEEDSEANGVDS